MAVLLDTDPDWTPAPPRIWVPKPEPHAWTVLRGGVADRLKGFGRQATRLFLPALRDSVSVAGAVPGYVAQLAGPSTSALNGPAGTRRAGPGPTSTCTTSTASGGRSEGR